MERPTATPGTSPQRTTPRWIALGGALVLLGWLDVLLPRAEPLLAVLLLAAAVGSVVLARRTAERTRSVNAAVGFGTLVIVGKSVWLLADWAPAWIVGQTGAILAGFCCFFVARRRSTLTAPGLTAPRATRRLAGAATLGALGVAALISLALGVTAITTDPLFRLLGVAGVNAVSAPASTRTTGPRGTVRISDVRYGSEYPNSVLDVYLARAGLGGSRPTFVYIHGGGYVLGDKVTGTRTPAPAGTRGAKGTCSRSGTTWCSSTTRSRPRTSIPRR